MGNMKVTMTVTMSEEEKLGMDQCTGAADDKGAKGGAHKHDMTAVTSTSQPEAVKALTLVLARPTLPSSRA
jgi:hypothetical protein